MDHHARWQEIRQRDHRGLQGELRVDARGDRQEAMKFVACFLWRTRPRVLCSCSCEHPDVHKSVNAARVGACATLLLTACLPLHAETPQDRGKRVVNECLTALGG